MKKLGVFLMLVVTVLSVSSCNTYIGLGRDIQKLGQGIQNTGYGKNWSSTPAPVPQPPVQ
jgi:predicted small secreted protein